MSTLHRLIHHPTNKACSSAVTCPTPHVFPLRSARLVLLGGAALVLSYVKAINASCLVIWGAGFRWFWSALVLFFVTPVLYGSYVCRALRLAVVFHPQVRRTLPWLIPVRAPIDSNSWYRTVIGPYCAVHMMDILDH